MEERTVQAAPMLLHGRIAGAALVAVLVNHIVHDVTDAQCHCHDDSDAVEDQPGRGPAEAASHEGTRADDQGDAAEDRNQDKQRKLW